MRGLEETVRTGIEGGSATEDADGVLCLGEEGVLAVVVDFLVGE